MLGYLISTSLLHDKECIQGLYNLLKFAHRPINPMHVHTIYWHYKSEQYPLMMIGGGVEMKEMPDLGNMVKDWIPVDFAAASIVQIMLKVANDNTGSPEQVYHIVNPNMVTW